MSKRPPKGGGAGGREILFEFIQIGGQVRVAAVDVATGVEAVVLGPAKAARADLEQLAMRKLTKLLEGGQSEDEARPKSRKGPGTFA